MLKKIYDNSLLSLMNAKFIIWSTIMIGYLEGRVKKIRQDGILLLSGSIGYEVLLPMVVLNKIKSLTQDDTVCLHIYYHQTERQPKPVLIGFHSELEKEFFSDIHISGCHRPLKGGKSHGDARGRHCHGH